MPNSAITPRLATKPNGRSGSAAPSPRRPRPAARSGTPSASARSCAAAASAGEHDEQHQRHIGGMIDASAALLSASAPARRSCSRPAAWRAAAQLLADLARHGRPLDAVDHVDCAVIAHSRPSRHTTPGSHTKCARAICEIVTDLPDAVGMLVSLSTEMVARSSTGWRTTMSISLLSSRNWPMVVPDRMVFAARITVCEVTPSARSLSWSRSRRSTLTDSFQLSFTPTVFGLARMMSLSLSA
jgi:hypothetical protein